jgi:hypothetical protein
MVEDFREKTVPSRIIVRHSLALHPACDSHRSESVSGGGSRSCFKVQKENQTQKHKENDPKGSPRQTQSKARLTHIFSWERHSPEWRIGFANREIGVPGGRKPRRGTWRLPVSALFFSPSWR